jgi:hypothetical protein
MKWHPPLLFYVLWALGTVGLDTHAVIAQQRPSRVPYRARSSASQNLTPNSDSTSMTVPPSMTETLACPDHWQAAPNPSSQPPLWSAVGSNLELDQAYIGRSQPIMVLVCGYRIGTQRDIATGEMKAYGSGVITLEYTGTRVPVDSCVVAPDKRSFLCKPGIIAVGQER